jgi:hypothetical protein
LGLKEYFLFLEIVYSFILGGAAKLRWAGGGAKRPDGHGNEPKKKGARSARARTRGQNPLVLYNYLIYVLCSSLGYFRPMFCIRYTALDHAREF